MSGTYVPGFSPSLQRFAIGGGVDTGQDYAPTPTTPQRQSTKPELAANLTALLAAQQAGQNPQMDPVEAALVAGMQQPTYSPEFQNYLGTVSDYMAGLGTPEIGRFINTIPLTQTLGGAGSGIKKFTGEGELSPYAARPAEQNVNYYGTLYDGSDGSPMGALNIGYNTPLVLVDNRTGQIVSQGTGYQAAQDMMKAAKGLTTAGGSKADWSIYTGEPGATDLSTYRPAVYDIPDQSMLGQFADMALTGLGSALGPLGAMAGSALSSIAQGRSLGGTLKNAAIAGGTTYLGGKLGAPSGLGSAADISKGTLDVLRAGGAGMAALQAAPDIIEVIANTGRVLGSNAGSAVGALSGAFGGNTSGPTAGNLQSAFDPNAQIVVSAPKPPVTVPLPSTPGLPSFPNIGITEPGLATNMGGIRQPTPQPDTQQPVDQTADPIVVKGLLDQGMTVGQILAMGVPIAAVTAAAAMGSASGAAGSAASGAAPTQPGTPAPATPDQIVVNAVKPPLVADAGVLAGLTGGVGAIPVIGGGNLPNVPTTTASGPEPNESILDRIGNLSTLDKIRLAGLGLGTIGDLFGGGGTQNTGTIPAGLGGPLNPVFSRTLPAANLPAAAPRAPQDIDYYRYGYGPQQSFFNNAPQGAANTSTAYTGYAEGGEVRDYDMEGALRAGIKPDEFGHMPDTYKLPNHMTFSEDSVYSTPEQRGGRWIEGEDGQWVFWPSEYNMAQHPMSEMQDYFERVEQNIPGRPDSYAVYPSDYRLPERKAVGGYAVGGPGDGREDKIPAMLSDGEYVLDAETVAMLGNGSSKAGAKKLDQFRVNVRKQKGRKMAKGQFSDDAKAPEHYLKGRN